MSGSFWLYIEFYLGKKLEEYVSDLKLRFGFKKVKMLYFSDRKLLTFVLVDRAVFEPFWLYEPRKNYICANHPMDSSGAIRSLRYSLYRPVQTTSTVLLGSVFVHGFRPVDVSGKSARFGRQSATPQASAVSFGISREIGRAHV